jgi:hypothetical protein
MHCKGKEKLQKEVLRRRHWKTTGTASIQEELHRLHALVVLYPTSILPYNKLLAVLARNRQSNDPYPSIFSFFSRLS